MAQAVEVPPIDQTAAPNANTDDLLSQLAGAELDKLLAEAEVEKQPPPAPPSTAPESAPQPLSELAAAAPEQPAAEEAQPVGSEASINAELDQLFSELNGNAAEPATATAPSDATFDSIPEPDPEPAPAPPVPVPAAPANASPAAAPSTEQPTTAQEQAALKEAIEHTPAEVNDSTNALPVYLKPLEWLSLPIQFVPEPARDLVGKVAIITFMNALAVIAYLLIFRR